jgi:hypothetical protein
MRSPGLFHMVRLYYHIVKPAVKRKKTTGVVAGVHSVCEPLQCKGWQIIHFWIIELPARGCHYTLACAAAVSAAKPWDWGGGFPYPISGGKSFPT